MKKWLIVVISIVVLVVTFTCGVLAESTVKEIVAQIDYAVQMKFDNVEWNPTEADGSAIRPITYNGRTYLPVRALCDKLNVAVDYDDATRTVLIGEREWTPIEAGNITGTDAYYTTDSDALFVGDGTCDFGGIFMDAYSTDHIKMSGDWSKMKGVLYANKDCTVEISDYSTGQMFKKVELKANQKVSVEFDIACCHDIRVNVDGHNLGGGSGATVVFGEVYRK